MPTDPRDFAPLAFDVVGAVNDQRFREGIERGEAALQRMRPALGPRHPLIGDVLNAMGTAYMALREGEVIWTTGQSSRTGRSTGPPGSVLTSGSLP